MGSSRSLREYLPQSSLVAPAQQEEATVMHSVQMSSASEGPAAIVRKPVSLSGMV